MADIGAPVKLVTVVAATKKVKPYRRVAVRVLSFGGSSSAPPVTPPPPTTTFSWS